MGQRFGSQPDEQIDKAFQVLADDSGRKPGSRPQTNYITTFPAEIAEKSDLQEGKKCQITVNKYERNPEAPGQCLKRYGAKCCICDFSFGDAYGDVAEGFIQVHHVKPVSVKRGTGHKVDPRKDLRFPVAGPEPSQQRRAGLPSSWPWEVPSLPSRTASPQSYLFFVFQGRVFCCPLFCLQAEHLRGGCTDEPRSGCCISP